MPGSPGSTRRSAGGPHRACEDCWPNVSASGPSSPSRQQPENMDASLTLPDSPSAESPSLASIVIRDAPHGPLRTWGLGTSSPGGLGQAQGVPGAPSAKA